MENHVLTGKKTDVPLCQLLFQKKNIPLSSLGNLHLISVYNENIFSVIMSTTIETAV